MQIDLVYIRSVKRVFCTAGGREEHCGYRKFSSGWREIPCADLAMSSLCLVSWRQQEHQVHTDQCIRYLVLWDRVGNDHFIFTNAWM